VTAIYSDRPDAESLAWALADGLITVMLKWDFAVLLLMAERHGLAFKTLWGQGPPASRRSGLCLGRLPCLDRGAGAMLRSALEIVRRADALVAAASKVRTRAPAR